MTAPNDVAALVERGAKAIYEARGLDKATQRSWWEATEGDKHYCRLYATAALEGAFDAIAALQAEMERAKEALAAVEQHERSNFIGDPLDKARRASWRGVMRKVRSASRRMAVDKLTEAEMAILNFGPFQGPEIGSNYWPLLCLEDDGYPALEVEPYQIGPSLKSASKVDRSTP